MIKVGQTAEVIEIINSHYESLYSDGSWGTVEFEMKTDGLAGDKAAFVGKGATSWHVPKHTFRTVGKLTVTKVKSDGK